MSEIKYDITIATTNRTLVDGQNFAFTPGKITFLLGESGIGKTLLSKAFFGILDEEGLTITINRQAYQDYVKSRPIMSMRQNGFFVFQEPSTHLNPLLTLKQQLNEGTLAKLSDDDGILDDLWHKTGREVVQKILNLYPKPYRPSGGEKQRILLAMAFKKMALLRQKRRQSKRALFVFDEPTGNLDDAYRNRFLDILFEQYRQLGFTILLITHDYSMISEIYRRHKNIINRIEFKELTRINGAAVHMQPFSAERYLSWLREQHPPAALHKKQTSRASVLQIKQSFSVYDRRFSFYSTAKSNKPVELCIQKGEMVYLKAPSGGGKTTLAKIVMGLQPAQNIRFNLAGLTLTEKSKGGIWPKYIWGKKAVMAFQHADEALNPQATVWENFRGLPATTSLTKKTFKKHLNAVFDKNIDERFMDNKAGLLSGGQKQRINLLRALLLNTDLVILDEPLNGLDFNSIRKVLSIIHQKQKQGQSFLIISHNEEIFDHFVPRTHIYYLRHAVKQ
ncbi:MAG: ATP-binding cassette domain-containing protein [Caldithrix sp.]|nr:ATP-binding cassette domain-containing protein [Caldithrix sp.]